MKYDLKAMKFNVEAARAGDLWNAFSWFRTPESEDFWFRAYSGKIPREEWQPKLDAMIAQWEQENEMRDPDEPKPLRDMTDAEIAALVRQCVMNGKTLQYHNPVLDVWSDKHLDLQAMEVVRIRPEPERKTFTLYLDAVIGSWCQSPGRYDTHRITFDLIDGKPDPDSIKMEEL